jgi:tyrosyl-DNA phosphodiesterase 2
MGSLEPVRFDREQGRWAPAEAGRDLDAATLTCLSYNVWFSGIAFEERAEALLRILRSSRADVIGLQEVTPAFLDMLLAQRWVQERYALSDSTGALVSPYGTLLLSRVQPLRCQLYQLPTTMARTLLVAELPLNGTITAVATVHLESTRPLAQVRARQLATIFPLLERYDHAVLMGDFNFCASWPEENGRLDPRYQDLWTAVRGDEPGFTEDTAVNTMRLLHTGKEKQVRYDRMLWRSPNSGWGPARVELLGDEPADPEEPEIFPSDHFGLLGILGWNGEEGDDDAED